MTRADYHRPWQIQTDDEKPMSIETTKSIPCRSWLFSLALTMSCFPALADDDLKSRIKDEHAAGAEHWVYNDIAAARVLAAAQNKPMFVTFRCVPCRDCNSFDAEVAKGSEVIKNLGRQEFICVRQVEMKNVDLTQFEFDHDLNWAAMFINADGTVYARYGTQSAAGPDAFNSVEGLERTMQRVLKLHADYPENKAELAGKLGKPKAYKTAMEMPGLPEGKQRFAGQTTRKNCIHCHMIHDAQHEHAQKSGSFDQEMLWRYPLPNNIGIAIDAKHGVKVAKLSGPAARSGLAIGDEVTHMNGQAVTSIADMQWVLHGLSNKPNTVEVRTKGGKVHTIQTTAGWKKSDISWRGSMWSVAPRMNVWAPELPDEKRRNLGLTKKGAALEVRWINRKQPGGEAAFAAGLRVGDVIIELGGKPVQSKPAQFQMHIKLNYKVGDVLPLTVLRQGKRRDVSVKLVN